MSIFALHTLVITGLFGIFAGTASAQTSSHAAHHLATGSTTMIETPPSIAAEHRELHEVLAKAAQEGGELGRAARELEKALAPHFKREEEIATPPLGLLPSLAKGEATTEMRAVLPMTTALESCRKCCGSRQSFVQQCRSFGRLPSLPSVRNMSASAIILRRTPSRRRKSSTPPPFSLAGTWRERRLRISATT